jgi:GT2 family glycosyltransferase
VERNVKALLAFDEAYITEVIVVDDCSPINNYIFFPSKVKIIRNSQNLHYTGTVNNGLLAAKGDIILLLDSDAYPTHSFLPQLIDLYTRKPDLGCVGFKTVDEQGNDTGNTMPEPSVLSLISGQYLHGKLRKYNPFASKNIMPFSCAVSFRKACLDDIGILDVTNFPVLDADQDMSMRIHRSRWQLAYEPSIEIFHKGGGSISKDGKRVLLFYDSRWKLLNKYHKTGPEFLVKNLVLLRLQFELWAFQIKKSTTQVATRRKLIQLVKSW